ncbi:universal stress protein [Streptomyces sp. NBC_00572]|uniref:universal stress protein n=1 Tax=Streptomyces sp. NBC_00572 TaxID=2903664 RepID=UPI00225A93A9|nr:universal stress protein [Streptomyces sp. NBC_00572]MCX4985451.1 universal stress protein [Streptomyces sp. NBC_00572]
MKQIAVGANGSNGSLAAVDWAAGEAASRGSGLQLVNASLWPEHQVAAVRESRDVRTERARALLAEASERARTSHPDVVTATEETEDAPARLLLARAADAELLVLGSHRAGNGSGYLSGHVAQEVLAAAERPVVLVREGAAPGGDKRVVVGLDVQHPADELLGFAFDFAARRGVPLHIVSAWHSALPHHRDGRDGSEAAARLRTALTAAAERHRKQFAKVDVTEEVVHDRPGNSLLEAASGAGLLVVGRRKRRAVPGTHIGAVTQAALHHVACPVAVVSHA